MQLVTLPIALQQLKKTPAHSALPPTMAMSASQLGLCQPYSTVAFEKFVSSDTRKLLSRQVKATHPGRAFQIHMSLAPFSPLPLSFTIHIAIRDIPVTDHYLERK